MELWYVCLCVVLRVPVDHVIRVMGAPVVKRSSQDPGGWRECAFPFRATHSVWSSVLCYCLFPCFVGSGFRGPLPDVQEFPSESHLLEICRSDVVE